MQTHSSGTPTLGFSPGGITILSRNEGNSLYYIIKQIKLLTLIERTNSVFNTGVPPGLLSLSKSDLRGLGKILVSDSLRRVVWYFLDYGAATSRILQFRTGTPEATVFRHIKTLLKLGVVVPAVKARKSKASKGGPRSSVWMVPDATIDYINEAQELNWRLLSPNYCMGEDMAQLILEEYMLPRQKGEISSREYQILLRDRGVKPSLIPDLTMFGMRYLKAQGIRVSWS